MLDRTMDHHHHDHEQSLPAERLKRMKQALYVNAGIFAIELAAGTIHGSNGLIAEAVHESADTVSHGLDVYGESHPKRSITFRRAAGSLICLAGAGIGIKSGVDLVQGSDVPGWQAGAVAATGAAANIEISRRLHAIEDHSHHSKGQLRHSQTDAIKSSAIAVGIVTAIATDTPWLDSAVGVGGGAITVAGNIGPTIEAWRQPDESIE